MKGTRESPSLIAVKISPAVNSDLVVLTVPENELPEAFSRSADVGSFLDHLRLLAARTDGIAVYDQTALHV